MSRYISKRHGLISDSNIYSCRVDGEMRTFKYTLVLEDYDNSGAHPAPFLTAHFLTPAQQLVFELRSVPFPTTGLADSWNEIHILRPYFRNWLNKHISSWALKPQTSQSYEPSEFYFERRKDLLAFAEEIGNCLSGLHFPKY